MGVIAMTTTTPSVASAPPASRTTPRRPWLLVLVIAGLVLALAVGVLIGRQGEAAQSPPGLASPTIIAMLESRAAAINDGTAEDIARFYTDDAVLEEHDRVPSAITEGAEAIGQHLNTYRKLGFQLQQTGTTTELGPFVAEPLLWSDGDGGYAVYRLSEDGRIAHQWVIGARIPA
jgi:ketosteroid isomerase-like protein